MAVLQAVAPAMGVVVFLDQVPDAVMAAGLLGPGLAVRPETPGRQAALCPAAGVLDRIYPHGAVVKTAAGLTVLLHLGVDTVDMGDAGFRPLVAAGGPVQPGMPLIEWDPSLVGSSGLGTEAAVIVLQGEPDLLVATAPTGVAVAAGDPLFAYG